MRAIPFLLLAFLACTESQPSLDCALGAWAIEIAYGPSTLPCFPEGETQRYPFQIVRDADDYLFVCNGCSEADGTIETDGAVCDVTARFVYPYREGWGVETDAFTLRADIATSAVTGDGRVRVRDPVTGDCDQPVTVIGRVE